MTTLSPAPPRAVQRTVAPGRRPAYGRIVFLVPAGVCLLVGLDAALLLLGVPAPVDAARLPDVHGMLLVFGFVGTLISLERAVALADRRGLAAPALLGVGGLALVAPVPPTVGKTLLVLGMVALVGVYAGLWRRQQDEAVLVQAFGAVLGVGALVLWAGDVPVSRLVPWLAAFVVLTIAGERLELARIAMGPSAGTWLVALSVVVAGSLVASLLWPTVGCPSFGAALLVLVAWLVRHDVARRTIRSSGLTRFMAGGMLAGYAWLTVAASTWALGGTAYQGARYDTVIHAVFLGFTMSMIMAHAPVILPAVLRRPLPYRDVMLVPGLLLQGSLVLRLWLGDARGLDAARTTGGVLNVVALLGFVVVALWSAARPPAERPSRSRHDG